MIENGSRKQRTTQGPTRTDRKRVEFKMHSGCRTLFMDGRPRLPIVMEISAKSDRDAVKTAFTGGITLITLDAGDLCWTEPGKFDSSLFDARITQAMDGVDGADYFIALHVDAPDWWLAINPKERAEYGRPNKDSASVVSWASILWRQQGGEALERLVKHLLRRRTESNCVGIQLLAGDGGGWVYPNLSAFPDTGLCMRDAFRMYAITKYRRNEGILRKAWFDARAEFSKIQCPDPQQRGKADYGVFRNPHHSRRLLDYYEALAMAQTDAMLAFASVVKRVSQGSLLVGYESVPVTATTSLAEAGHSVPAPLLDSPDVDFFVETHTGGGGDLFRPFRGSLELNGKFVFIRSTSKNTAVVLQAYAQGAGSIVSCPAGMSAAGALVNVVAAVNKNPVRQKKVHSQLAIVLDPGAGLVVAQRPDAASIISLIQDQLASIARAGVPLSVYSYADLFHSGFPDHKAVILPDCFYLTEPERRKLDARVKRSGQTVIWFWAPGMIGEESISAENGSKCCGQKVRIEPGAVSLRTRIVVSNDPLTWGRHSGEMVGPELAITPTCTVADKQSTRLGSNSANKTSFSVRRFDTWTSVVFGTLPVPMDLLHNALKSAACHVFCTNIKTGDNLTTDGRTLALYSRTGGAYNVSLPGQFDVIDVLSSARVGVNVSEVSITLSPESAGLYDLRPVAFNNRA